MRADVGVLCIKHFYLGLGSQILESLYCQARSENNKRDDKRGKPILLRPRTFLGWGFSFDAEEFSAMKLAPEFVESNRGLLTITAPTALVRVRKLQPRVRRPQYQKRKPERMAIAVRPSNFKYVDTDAATTTFDFPSKSNH